MSVRLDSIEIEAFKSIAKQRISLGDVNVFIGANGSGKSNLISAFTLLRRVAQREAQAAVKVAGVDRFLRFGRKHSPYFTLALTFGQHGWRGLFVPTEDDGVLVSEEWKLAGAWSNSPDTGLSVNAREIEALAWSRPARKPKRWWRGCRAFAYSTSTTRRAPQR